MAIIKRLGTAFTGAGASAPKLIKYDRMESDGSLMLIDATHPVKSFQSGIQGTGDTIPNIFSSNLASLSGKTTNLDGRISQSVETPKRIEMERTAKGGIHGIVQQPRDGVTLVYDEYNLLYPISLLEYLVANNTHDIYVSLWQRVTHASSNVGGLGPSYATLIGGEGGLSDIGFALRGAGLRSNYPTIGDNVISSNSEIDHLFAAGLHGTVKSLPSDSSSFMWQVGKRGLWNGSGVAGSQDELPSQIFYRIYMEDLTVSGRSYADAFAIDKALYTKEVLTAGGRYYGDTFTDPKTFTFPT